MWWKNDKNDSTLLVDKVNYSSESVKKEIHSKKKSFRWRNTHM